jgi:hypothetical protein
MTTVFDNQNEDLLSGPAEGVGKLTASEIRLGKTKVAQGDVTSGIQQDVFRFQVTANAFCKPFAAEYHVTSRHSPVDNVVFVQMLESEHQLGDVKPRTRLGKPPFLLQVPEQLSTALVIRHKEQVVLGLETEFQADQEWRVKGLL